MDVDNLSLESMAFSGFGKDFCVSPKMLGFLADAVWGGASCLMQVYAFY